MYLALVSAPPDQSPRLLLDEHETLQSDHICVRCGYSLIGLPIRGKCPECGTPIRRSLPVGEQLSPRQIADARRDIGGLCAPSVFGIAALVLAMLFGRVQNLSADTALAAGAAALALLSIIRCVVLFRLTNPARLPKPFAHVPDPRATIRVCGVFSAAGWVVAASCLAFLASAGGPPYLYGWLNGVCGGALAVTGLAWLVGGLALQVLVHGVVARTAVPQLSKRLDIAAPVIIVVAVFTLPCYGLGIGVLWLGQVLFLSTVYEHLGAMVKRE